ncbi:hypothetical protein I7S93_28230 (plasmid) [Klebsiella pneumoniae]|nr:hypothetical protein I7S93_28230 [Klebsiella pneumoniae]
MINGIYTVRVQYPVSLKLDGQERSLPAANYIIELTIQQTDPREKAPRPGGQADHHDFQSLTENA